jgi:hypothetical protein
MMQFLLPSQFMHFRVSSCSKLFRSRPLIFLAACAGLGLSLGASAREAKSFAPATMVEAADYLPCDNGCSANAEPASAFCFKQGDQIVVGEGRSYLHENKFSGLEELAGKQVHIRYSSRFVWVKQADGATVKMERNSEYENFRDAGCVREVRKPIVEGAYLRKRPSRVPRYAFVLAGSGKDDLYLWFQCDLSADKSVIACQRWFRNGDYYGKDWYCARTLDGAPVAADFEIDPLLSQEGKLVLKSGAVVQRDHRARTNDALDRPNEACR